MCNQHNSKTNQSEIKSHTGFLERKEREKEKLVSSHDQVSLASEIAIFSGCERGRRRREEKKGWEEDNRI